MKKFLSLALALMLVLAIACTASAETKKIIWWVYASGDAPIDTALVVEAANKYSAEKIGVEVELIFKNEEQFNLGMQTGEAYDMTFTCDWANDFASNAYNEMFYDITDLVKTAAPALYETIDQKYWDVAGSLNGKIYAVPTLKDMASQQFFRLDHPLEFGAVYKIVVYAVFLSHAGRTGGERDREIQVLSGAEQFGDHRALSHTGRAGKDDEGAFFLFTIHCCSSSSSFILAPSFSKLRAERTTWSLSIMSTEAVLRPYVASISRPRSRLSCTIRLMGADSGLTMASNRWAETIFPKPMLISFKKITPYSESVPEFSRSQP